MPESIKSLKFVYDYAKSLFEKRKDNHFEESMKNSLFEKEETAIKVFVHAVTLLNWASKKTINPDADNKEIAINLDPESTAPLHEQLLDLFKVAFEAYEEARNKFKEEDLQTTFKSPFGREMTYEDWFGFIIHHTIGHIYQTFRLQAIYLRHKV
ncbi:MAG: DinB family protein [Candidatus Lokiarchaeota archaeon]|nr:DinB family protein [Candidatus Lokiarchaeota archaeon]